MQRSKQNEVQAKSPTVSTLARPGFDLQKWGEQNTQELVANLNYKVKNNIHEQPR